MENFTLVPRFALYDDDLSDGAYRIYSMLQDYAFQSIYCFPSIEKMAEDTNKSLSTIKRAVTELKEKGYIAVFRENMRANNTYVLVPEKMRKGMIVLNSVEEFNAFVSEVREYYEKAGEKKSTKRKKKATSDLSTIRAVEEKIASGDYNFDIKELAAIYKWANQEYRSHPITINYGRDYTALRTLFGDKEVYGKFEMLMLIKYVQAYDNLFKAPKYPHPSLWGFSRAWQFDKIKAIVEHELAAEERLTDELSERVY